jgi:SpoIIAA-like
MIKELSDLPTPLVGFELSGKLHAEDYRDVLLPVIEKAAQVGDVRIVLVIPEFGGISAGALWEDLKMGIEHLHSWKRIALVTDVEWMTHALSLFGWMTPGEVKHFSLAEKADAVNWARG